MEVKAVKLSSPLKLEELAKLRAGDRVLLSGVIYAARDAAHRRLVQALEKGEKPPIELKGATIYYMGPSPTPPGKVIGSAGPTTSGRMDRFTPQLLSAGVKGMIGKGFRSTPVKEAIKKYQAVYFAALGGAGALISQRIKSAELVGYPELGPEAIRRLEVADLPLIVINDIYGGDLYTEGRERYRKDRGGEEGGPSAGGSP